ncbi:MAG: helix-turn-helix domain-containing protein [Acidimicrobiales bacterium]
MSRTAHWTEIDIPFEDLPPWCLEGPDGDVLVGEVDHQPAEPPSAVRVEHVTPSVPEVAPCPVPPGRAAVDELAHPDSVLLRAEEAGDRLRLSRARIYELMRTGELPSVTIGKSRRVPLTALIEFIQSKQD